MLRDQTAQAKIFKKLGKKATDWQIRRAILGDDNQDTPALLKFVTRAVYEAAGGTIIRDLFVEDGGGVSDVALLQRLAVDKLDAKVAELTDPNGGEVAWSWASRADELPREWEYTWTKMKLTKGAANYDAKEKAGAVVEMQADGGGFKITYGVVKPGEKKKAAAPAAKKKGDGDAAERGLSQNMVYQLQIRASEGVAIALEQQPDVCLAAITASFLAGFGPLHVTVNGLRSERRSAQRDFATTFKAMLSKSAAMKGIAQAAAMAVDFRNDGPAPLQDDDAATMVKAINAKALNAAMRKVFAGFAQEYLEGIPVPMLRAALFESGVVHKDTVEVMKWGRSNCVGLAMADNGKGPEILTTGWLPPELRGPGYDGPKAKAKPAKGAKKKKARR